MACVVKRCKSRMGSQGNRSENLSFHRFPSDKILRKAWIAAVSYEVGWTPKKHHRVCSKHFTEECFTCDDKWRRLNDNSVPTLHLHVRRGMPTSHPSNSTHLTLVASMDCTDGTMSPKLIAANFEEPLNATHLHLELNQGGDVHTSNLHERCTEHLVRIEKLEKKVAVLEKIAKRRLLKINSLKQHARRIEKRNVDINSHLIDTLREQNEVEDDLILLDYVKNNKLLERYLSQLKGEYPREYSSEVKEFAVTLHSISPQAYNFVREELNNVLPHYKTIEKWNQGTDCNPDILKYVTALDSNDDSQQMEALT